MFKRRRKLMQQTLGPRSIPNYHNGLQVETKRFVQSLLADPENYMRHIRRYSGGLVLSVVYGYNATSSDDKYLLLAEESMNLLANEMITGVGVWPVDVFPVLRYIPAWFPGGSFKRKAKIWKKKMEEFVELPFIEAKGNAASISICFFWHRRSYPVYRQQEPFYPHFAVLTLKTVINLHQTKKTIWNGLPIPCTPRAQIRYDSFDRIAVAY